MNLPLYKVMLVAVFLTSGCGMLDSLRANNSNLPEDEDAAFSNDTEDNNDDETNFELPQPPEQEVNPDLPLDTGITPTLQ